MRLYYYYFEKKKYCIKISCLLDESKEENPNYGYGIDFIACSVENGMWFSLKREDSHQQYDLQLLLWLDW